MYSKIFAVAILTVAMASLSIVLVPHALASGGQKCLSSQSDTGTSLGCDQNKKEPFLSGETKKECRESNDKCSSSQTGYGEIGRPTP